METINLFFKNTTHGNKEQERSPSRSTRRSQSPASASDSNKGSTKTMDVRVKVTRLQKQTSKEVKDTCDDKTSILKVSPGPKISFVSQNCEGKDEVAHNASNVYTLTVNKNSLPSSPKNRPDALKIRPFIPPREKVYSLTVNPSTQTENVIVTSNQNTVIKSPTRLGRPPGRKNNPKVVMNSITNVEHLPKKNHWSAIDKDSFLVIFGLVSKVVLKEQESKSHRLHRAAGGKLRRKIKPKQAAGMYYRNFQVSRSGVIQVSADEFSSSDEQDERRRLAKQWLPPSPLKKSRSVPTTPEQHSRLLADVKKRGAGSPMLAKRKLDLEQDRDLCFSNSEPVKKRKQDWLKPPTRRTPKKDDDDDDIVASVVTSYREQVTKLKKKSLSESKIGSSSLVKQKLIEKRTKSFEVKSSKDENKVVRSNLVMIKERIEERHTCRPQRSNKRKQWGHLLRANPDEFEAPTQFEERAAKEQSRKKVRVERSDSKEEDVPETEEVHEKEVTENVKVSKKKKKSEVLNEDMKEKGNSSTTNIKSTKKVNNSNKATVVNVKKLKAMPNATPQAEVEKDCSKEKALKKKKKEKKVEDVETHRLSYLEESGHIVVEYKDDFDDPQVVVIIGSDDQPLSSQEHAMVYRQLKGTLKGMLRDADCVEESRLVSLSLPGRFTSLSEEERESCPSNGLPQSFLSDADGTYHYRIEECVIPHMCRVCWVNDHMYCRNMKRIARSLPPFGGCIHYIPCKHFRHLKESMNKLISSRKAARLSTIDGRGATPTLRSLRESPINTDYAMLGAEGTSLTIAGGKLICTTPPPIPTQVKEEIRTRPRTKSVSCLRDEIFATLDEKEDLTCNEVLLDSDTEPNSPKTPAGTERLKVELKARAVHIARSLGFKDENELKSPEAIRSYALKAPLNINDEVVPSDAEVILEEYGSEVTVVMKGDESKESLVGTLAPLSQSHPNKDSGKTQQEEFSDNHGSDPLLGVHLVPLAGRYELSEYMHIQGREFRIVKIKLMEVRKSTKVVTPEKPYDLPLSAELETLLNNDKVPVSPVEPVSPGIPVDLELSIDTKEETSPSNKAHAAKVTGTKKEDDRLVTLVSPAEEKNKQDGVNADPPVVWMSESDFEREQKLNSTFKFKGNSLSYIVSSGMEGGVDVSETMANVTMVKGQQKMEVQVSEAILRQARDGVPMVLAQEPDGTMKLVPETKEAALKLAQAGQIVNSDKQEGDDKNQGDGLIIHKIVRPMKDGPCQIERSLDGLVFNAALPNNSSTDIVVTGDKADTSTVQENPTGSSHVIHSDVNLPSGLQDRIIPRQDGSQVLAFTTKDLREQKPELMAYIKVIRKCFVLM